MLLPIANTAFGGPEDYSGLAIIPFRAFVTRMQVKQEIVLPKGIAGAM